jgi:MFS family permease
VTELLQETASGCTKHDNKEKRTVVMSDDPEDPALPNGLYPSGEGQDVRTSLRTIFSNRNYTTFLFTAWVFSTFAYLSSYLNLYLKVLGWSILLIGMVMSIVNAACSIMRLIGGYVGDIADRKKIAVAAHLILGIYYVYMGLFVDFWLIFVALLIYSVHELFRSGSSAYIMQNVPKKQSGFALSLFTSGRGMGIIALVAFGFLQPAIGFTVAFRLMYFVTGLCLIVSAGIRGAVLEPANTERTPSDKPILSEFLSENIKAGRMLLAAIPGLVLVIVLDALSDSFFNFAAIIYTYEDLSIDISGINLMLVTQLLISVPLLLKMGRLTDRKGVKKAAMAVYSIMPISAAFLYIAPTIPYVFPLGVVDALNSVIPGLGVICSTPFIGIVMKYVNDALWGGLVIILIRKRLPKTDTAKILSIFWVMVYILSSVGPGIAGLIYVYMTPPVLFLTIIVLNLMLLAAIAVGPFGNDMASLAEEAESS